MSLIQVNTYNKHIGVEEQDLVIKFAFLVGEDNIWKNINDFSECRDFLGDVVYASHTNTNILGLYGFFYDPKNTGHLDKTSTNLGMKFPTITERDIFLKNYETWAPIFNKDLELSLDGSVTIFENDPTIICVHLDPAWQQTCVSISLLSYILKSLCWYLSDDTNFYEALARIRLEDDKDTKEFAYIKTRYPMFKVLMANINKIINSHSEPSGYDKVVHIGNIHNRSGFFHNIMWTPSDTVAGRFLKSMGVV